MRIVFLQLLILVSLNASASELPISGSFEPTRKSGFFDFARYKDGCSIQGLPFVKPQIDERLPFGKTFKTIEKSVSEHAPARIVERDILIWLVSEKKLGFFEIVSKSINSSIVLGQEVYNSCPLTDGSLRCVVTPKVASLEQSSCTGDRGIKSHSVIELGTFKSATGQIVDAYRTVYSVRSKNYKCSSKNVGTVTTVVTTIHTNEIPSWESSKFCGGTLVYESRLTHSQSGELVHGYSKEVSAF